MRFESKDQIKDGLLNIKNDKDKQIVTHIQNVTPVMEQAKKLRKVEPSPYSKKSTNKLIGTIPEIVFLQHPEWIHRPDLISQYLNSEEGSVYRTTAKRV